MNAIEKGINFRLREGIMLPRETEPLLHGYKEPLTPIQDGYGYIGTLAYNKERTHVQCHLCGFFYKSLGHHITKVHAMKTSDYRRRVGLSASTSLASPAFIDLMRERTAESLAKANTLTRDEKRVMKMRANLEVGRKTMEVKGRFRSHEQLNKLGRCPEQLLRKIEVLAQDLGQTPTKRDFIARYGDGGDLNSIYLTYGTWNNAVQLCGLDPNRGFRR